MDGFPSTVTMGSLISTLLQLKAQVDFMDQFLSLYSSDYIQLKNYAIETQQNGMATAVPPSPFQATVPASSHEPGVSRFAGATMASTIAGGQMVMNNRNHSVANQAVSIGKTKAVRKQSLKKLPTSTPTPLKRRGRKRKYPISTSVENAAPFNNYQNNHPVHQQQNTESVIKIFIPASSKVSGDCGFVDQQKVECTSHTNNAKPVNGTKIMSSLDILAAVSYVLKQKDMGNITMVHDITSASSEHMSVDQQAESNFQNQCSHSNHNMKNDGGSNLGDTFCSGFNGITEGENVRQPLQNNHHSIKPDISFSRPNKVLQQVPSSLPDVSQNRILSQEEKEILGNSPEHEIVI